MVCVWRCGGGWGVFPLSTTRYKDLHSSEPDVGRRGREMAPSLHTEPRTLQKQLVSYCKCVTAHSCASRPASASQRCRPTSKTPLSLQTFSDGRPNEREMEAGLVFSCLLSASNNLQCKEFSRGRSNKRPRAGSGDTRER